VLKGESLSRACLYTVQTENAVHTVCVVLWHRSRSVHAPFRSAHESKRPTSIVALVSARYSTEFMSASPAATCTKLFRSVAMFATIRTQHPGCARSCSQHEAHAQSPALAWLKQVVCPYQQRPFEGVTHQHSTAVLADALSAASVHADRRVLLFVQEPGAITESPASTPISIAQVHMSETLPLAMVTA
jgi:hypothetical protein